MVKRLTFFIYIISFLLFCCQFVSSEDLAYTYEEPIRGLQFGNSVANSDGTMMLLMIAEDLRGNGCSLPEIHLRLIDKLGLITYIDFNYTFPAEALCPKIELDFKPLTYNYIMLLYPKSTNAGVKKYGLIINYSGEVISKILLGNFDAFTERSISLDKGFINIERPDANGIAAWKRFSAPDAITGNVVESGSGGFRLPNAPLYHLMGSSNFNLIDGGFGCLYILKYNGTKALELNDPNIQHWRIYVSFLKVGTDYPTIPTLVYQTTKELNNIEAPSTCVPTFNGEGYTCVISLNNTVTKIARNQRITQTVKNYYQLGFLTNGAFVRLDIIKQANSTEFTAVDNLFYGGFLVINSYENTNAIDGNILDNDGNIIQSWGSFGPEFVHYNQFRRNNTIYGIKEQNGQKLNILLKTLPKLANSGVEYQNPIIVSTDPPINGVISFTTKEITITYNIPVALSTANISIFQFNEDDEQDLLRQTFSGQSKWCSTSDNLTVHIQIFESTFNLPNTTYYVTIENNFVKSYQKDEPLIGVTSKTWILSTEPSFKGEHHSDSVTGLIRLNKEGSLKFQESKNRSEYFQNIIQEFNTILPLGSSRLSTDESWQHDPDESDKVLLSFRIKEADDDKTEQSSLKIYKTMNSLILSKGFTALSNNNYTALIDDTVQFRMTQNYFEKFFILIMMYVIFSIILIILYFLARQKNPDGKNFAIFGTAFVVQNFAVHLAFILFSAKNVPTLLIPSITFFVLAIIFNCLLALNIFVFELTNNPSFVTWFTRYPALSSMFTLFSAADIQVLDILSSELAGLTIFSAPLTQRSKKLTFFGIFVNIFIEDLPQFIMQIIYYQNVITYDFIPSIALVSGGLVIGNKLIWRSYDALVRCHQRNKNRNLEKIRLNSGVY